MAGWNWRNLRVELIIIERVEDADDMWKDEDDENDDMETFM